MIFFVDSAIFVLFVGTIEIFAVWLCTKFAPLLGNRTDGSLTTQWGKLRVNCIPKDKLQSVDFKKILAYKRVDD
ncbi:hypothetical protein [Helicobacter sp. 23-1045]